MNGLVKWEVEARNENNPKNKHTKQIYLRPRNGRKLVLTDSPGNEFTTSVRDLPRICELVGASRIEYFGDIDARGLLIPIAASRSIMQCDGRLHIAPAARWYEHLFALGKSGEAPVVEITESLERAIAWLPEHLRSHVRSLFAEGGRLAQEAIGAEFLAEEKFL